MRPSRRVVGNNQKHDFSDLTEEQLESNDFPIIEESEEDGDHSVLKKARLSQSGTRIVSSYALIVLCFCFAFGYFHERSNRLDVIAEYDKKVAMVSKYLAQERQRLGNQPPPSTSTGAASIANQMDVIFAAKHCPDCPECPHVLPVLSESQQAELMAEKMIDRNIYQTVTWSWKTKTEALTRAVQKMSAEMVSRNSAIKLFI
jgi:hypothetical protein